MLCFVRSKDCQLTQHYQCALRVSDVTNNSNLAKKHMRSNIQYCVQSRLRSAHKLSHMKFSLLCEKQAKVCSCPEPHELFITVHKAG